MKRRVAITGLGIVSAIGNNAAEAAQALYHGRSGVVADPGRKTLGFTSCLTGAIKPYEAGAWLSRKQRKTMPEFALWAADACFQAVAQSGIDPVDLQNEASGVIFSCDSSCLSAAEQVDLLRESASTASLGSGLVFRSMTSCLSMNLSVIFRTKGAAWTISAACAGGGHALGQAADLIALGRQERILCGGAQEINWQSVCSFDALGAFSRREDEPERACRPFDADRDGLVPGGGAAAILLENRDLARKRGARILGEIAGYGFSSDGESLFVPGETGIGRAMRMALSAAGKKAADISYVCAHATSTPLGDAVEARNIAELFGDRAVPVSSTKSLTGHELWMSGAAQAVYATIMARDSFLAPNLNFSAPDQWSARLDVIAKARVAAPRATICNSAGFGGTNASLVLNFQDL
ncbi:MAG: beta-ketoacyl-[acyl-carrier-protein] synthase family protein [Desulfovibrio sp.]|jgi:3-oxoacyl-[acyl-carrier-protein] synthase-1|nr:beta-ketoacyl-[acyl-carrier-protein] synthase family protein [Desulfovibrio sp.]